MQSVVIGRVIGWLCAWSVMASFTCAQDAAPPAGPIEIEAIALDRPVDFTIDVLPILKQSCIACHHGPDAESALVLEDAAAILAGGDSGPAVDLKNPAGSLLLRVAAKLEKPFMPPRNNKVGAPPLTPQQLGMLKLWIEQGAKGPSRKFPPPPQWQGLPPGWRASFAVALSDDGQYAAVGRGDQIIVYHVPSGQMLARLIDPSLQKAAHLDAVQALAFSPDGTLLASGGYRQIKLWRLSLSERRFKVAVPALVQPAPALAAASADGNLLALRADPRTFNIIDAQTGQQIRQVTTDGPARQELQAATDLVDFAARELNLYTAQVQQFAKVLEDATTALNQAKASAQAAEQDIVTKRAAVEGVVAEIAAAEQAAAQSEQAVQQAMEKDRQATEALNAAAGLDPASEKAMELTNAASAAAEARRQSEADRDQKKSQLEAVKARKSEADTALAAAIQAQEKALAAVKTHQESVAQHQQPLGIAQAAKEKAAAAHQAATALHQQATARVSESRPVVTAATFALDGSMLLLGGEDGTVQFASVGSTGRPARIKLHGSAIVSLSFDDEGHLLSVASDGEARVGTVQGAWQLDRTIQPGESTEPPIDRVTALAFSPDGQVLTSGGGVPSREGELVFWSPADGSIVRRIESPHSDTVLAIAFNADGSLLATGGADKFARLFATATGQLLRSFEGHTHHVLAVSLNRNGHVLATAGADRVVKIWNIHDGSQIRTVDGFDRQVTRLVHLGPREDFAAAWGHGRVQLIHENSTRGRAFQAGNDYIYALDTTDDGQLIAAAGHDGVLHIWEAHSGQLIGQFAPDQAP